MGPGRGEDAAAAREADPKGRPRVASIQSGMAKTPEYRRALVGRILSSPHFHKSARLRAFLTYITEQAQIDPHASIGEQEIAEKVFGRTSDETSDDTIVRVHASQLRKRLEQYFTHEGANEEILLEIPKGNYLPVFRPRVPPPVEIPSEPVALPPPVSSWSRLWRPVLGGVGLILLIWLIQDDMSLRHQVPRGPDEEQRQFWFQFLDANPSTDIVLADSSLSLFQDLTKIQVDLPSYVNRDYIRQLDRSELMPQIRETARSTSARRHTSIADANIARKISLLAGARNDHIQLMQARDFQARLLRTDNVVLVGGPRSSPWVDVFQDKMNFRYTYLKDIDTEIIVNRQPKPGEASSYRSDDRADSNLPSGYCLLAYLPNLGDTGKVLIIAGTEMEGTGAGGDFILTGTTLKVLRKVLGVQPGQPFPYFEALLRTTLLGGTSPRAEVLAYRLHN